MRIIPTQQRKSNPSSLPPLSCLCSHKSRVTCLEGSEEALGCRILGHGLWRSALEMQGWWGWLAVQLASQPSFELRLALRPLVHQPQVVLRAGVQVLLHIRLAPPQRLTGCPGGAGGAACSSTGGTGAQLGQQALFAQCMFAHFAPEASIALTEAQPTAVAAWLRPPRS